MSTVDVKIHAVWGTKNRQRLLTKEIRLALIDHVRENAKSKNIFIDTINGYTDHIHILFNLNADMSLSKAINLLKGESSFWINQNKLVMGKFEWASEYFAASVGRANLEMIREYIRNQEEHHRKLSFAEEYDRFLRSFGFASEVSKE